MDETAMAFEAPHVRAAATEAPGLADRISVRDYTRDVEIGAFRSERGVTQRVRFGVVLEVSHGAAARADDVDKVLSYDTVIDAIERALAAERLDLLETLAERIAADCLADPRALRVFVRIEKLDRIPGALGVEIARVRPPADASRIHAVSPPHSLPPLRPLVAYLGPDLVAGPDRSAWLDAALTVGRPCVLVLGPAEPQPPARTEAALRAGLLAIEAAVWRLADQDSRLTVVETRTELDWSLKSGLRPVWAPVRMLTNARRPDVAHSSELLLDASRPEALAVWLAAAIDAEALILAGAGLAPATPVPLRRAAVPRDLAA